MIAILSPAKNMRSAKMQGLSLTEPDYSRQTAELSALLRAMSPWQFESAMQLNPDLALKAFGLSQDFPEDIVSARGGSAAALSYYGLAYQHLDAATLSLEDFAFAQDHLRIVSALYGLLRPADRIFPYRLEFQCRVKPGGKSLYAFWGGRLREDLFRLGEPVINLASGEYSKAVRPKHSGQGTMITCEFKTRRGQKLITLPTEAKMARGRMARFIVQNRLDSPERLTSFDWGGWTFQPGLSSGDTLVFIR